MQIGNRFRCYPTPEQAHTLLQWIGCQRHIYNAKVGEDRYFRRFARKSLQHTGQYAPIDQQYAHFKSELTPWLSAVPSVVLRNGAVLWKQAYLIRRGETPEGAFSPSGLSACLATPRRSDELERAK